MSTAIYVRRVFFGVVPIIALVLGYGEVFMSQARATEGVKNVVLVHGDSWTDPVGKASTSISRKTATT